MLITNNSQKIIRVICAILTLSFAVSVFPVAVSAADNEEVVLGLSGDADGNGAVQLKDIAIIQKYIIEAGDLENTQQQLCDIDGNGSVDLKDVYYIQNYILGRESGGFAVNTYVFEKCSYDKKCFSVKVAAAGSSVDNNAQKSEDLRLQSEIFALLSQKEFTAEAWNSYDLSARKQMLQKLVGKINEIQNTSVNENITFSESSLGTIGSYNKETNKITVNVNYISQENSYSKISSIIHEMRHAYQYAAVASPEKYIITSETLSEWSANFQNYISAANGVSGYLGQPIEYDARAFAKQYGTIVGIVPTYFGSWTV